MFYALGAAAPGLSHAEVQIANAPLFLTTNVEPNVVFIIDDSGSMMFETLPDELTYEFFTGNVSTLLFWLFPPVANLHGGGDYFATSNANWGRLPLFRVDNAGNVSNFAARVRSAHNNPLYYNPAVTYRPWSLPNNTAMPAADPSAAPIHPMDSSHGTRDLTSSFVHGRWWRDNGTALNANITVYPATYYHFTGDDPSLATSYQHVEIRPANGPFTGQGRESRSDCADAGAAVPSCTYAEEIQNFANWYSYHRNRIFTSRGGIGRAFARFDGGMRVGYGAINHSRTGTVTLDGVAGRTVVRGVRPFTGAHKQSFFDELYERPIPPEGTPLRRALEGVGQYYSRDDARGPWSSTPGAAGGTDYGCRQSYAILMTDGYTTGTLLSSGYGAEGSARRQNTDGTTSGNMAGPIVNSAGDSFTYSPVDPYQDDASHNLADVAMYYWKRDLRPDLANRVPTSPRNEAYWQHMVTYGVGLGVSGSIEPDTAWQAAKDGTAIAWPDPQWNYVNCGDSPGAAACPARIDDLLHAAVNSRGGFFSVMDPDQFAAQLAEVLDDIIGRVEDSATSAAASAAVIQADTLLYLAGFRSGDWSGELKAFALNADGSVGALAWDAEQRLAATDPDARRIYTRNSASGNAVALELSLLSPAQQSALGHAPDGTADGLASQRVAWLRGTEHEALRARTAHGTLRLLGDVVHSSPQFVGKPNQGYSLLPGAEGAAYASFRSGGAYASRPSMIYVGANDGVLHAFHAATGDELFAYMPAEVLLPETGADAARINTLMDPDYTHRYFVDGTATVGDAYVGGSWRTVLIGTMGAGGRTVFALDVTDPNDFSESKVLWEFTHPNLGYGAHSPSIVRMADGTWAAVFGNGYNSAGHTAGLFIVPLEAPASYRFVNTGVGSAATPNGLAPAVASDWPAGELSAQRLYAGDLLGNLWRFDVSATNPAQWTSPANRAVLFQATDAAGAPQPITARPEVAVRPGASDELMVLFGTGSYFRPQDGNLGSPQIQSIYGLRDTGTSIGGRDDLVAQQITWEGEETFTTATGDVTYTLRQVTSHDAGGRGWYIDLVYGNNAQGERVISAPTFPSGSLRERVRFATLIPDNDPCGTGRRGFLMEFDLASGSAWPDPVFDLNKDGEFDEGDHVNGAPVSGVSLGGGESPTTVLSADGSVDHIFDGSGDGLAGSPSGVTAGRQSWRQFR